MTVYKMGRPPVGHPFNPGPGQVVIISGPRTSAAARPNASVPPSTGDKPASPVDPMAGAMAIMDRDLAEQRERGPADPESRVPSPPGATSAAEEIVRGWS